MARSPRILLATLATLVMSAVGAGLLTMVMPRQAPSFAAESGVAANGEPLTTARDLATAFNKAARSLRPSVVSIRSVARVQPQPVPRRPVPRDVPEEFRRFFEDDLFDDFRPRAPRGGFERRGLGSGVIVSRDGYIVTNNHVIRGATEIDVTLHDGRTLSARVVGADAKTDVAVLKVEDGNLVPAPLGDSDALEVGDWVLAIGTPFELEQTVTAGIVSAKSRSSVGLTDYEDFIQTDAAINPGNSGGPLVNLSGEVVGINTAIASRTGGYMGIGFAIPSNMVRLVKDSLVRDGKVERGQLGALIQDLDEGLARSFGYDSTKGVLIGDVLPDSAAQRAGLQSGDIVVSYNGRPVTNAAQLRNRVAATKPNTRVRLGIFRDGRERAVEAVVGRLEDEQVVVDNGPESADRLGLTVETLSAEIAQQLGYDEAKKGVVITRVEPGSAGARSGLLPGDVIVGLGGESVSNARQFQELIDKQDLSRGIRLTVEREGVRRFLFLQSRGQ